MQIETTYRVGGKVFDTEDEAMEFRARIAPLASWFGNEPLTAGELLDKIEADPAAAREVLVPLMPGRRSRGPDKTPRRRKANGQAEVASDLQPAADGDEA